MARYGPVHAVAGRSGTWWVSDELGRILGPDGVRGSVEHLVADSKVPESVLERRIGDALSLSRLREFLETGDVDALDVREVDLLVDMATGRRKTPAWLFVLVDPYAACRAVLGTEAGRRIFGVAREADLARLLAAMLLQMTEDFHDGMVASPGVECVLDFVRETVRRDGERPLVSALWTIAKRSGHQWDVDLAVLAMDLENVGLPVVSFLSNRPVSAAIVHDYLKGTSESLDEAVRRVRRELLEGTCPEIPVRPSLRSRGEVLVRLVLSVVLSTPEGERERSRLMSAIDRCWPGIGDVVERFSR